MTGPVSASMHNFRPVSDHLQPRQIQGTAPPGSGSIVSAPGNGHMRVHNELVSMTALNTSGLTSAFATINSRRMHQLNNMGLKPMIIKTIGNKKPSLAAEAKKDMDAIFNSEMNNFPHIKNEVKELTLAYMRTLSKEQQFELLKAAVIYQNTYGDNFLMNISVMGYQSLEKYLQSRDGQEHSNSKVGDFVAEFSYYYNYHGNDNINSVFSDYFKFNGNELDFVKTRIEDTLATPAKLLQNFIHSAPRISDGPLLKGMEGRNNPLSTQVNGKETLYAILNGNALHFNGFLSTTADHATALRFAVREPPHTSLGNPIYTIDLTEKASQESEMLRRLVLVKLGSGNVNTSSILLSFKADHVAGVSLNTLQDVSGYHTSLREEDEILLAPGHYFLPEKVIINDKGIAVTGNLKYGRE
ncbi:hypothetical protein [Serratia ficaria]|uniref:hypothetical protein n=1 Tax=Serratia ficaria TaxID=61651 RepID=UPI000AED9963|nr:hypothetical protein [Serratia ficaria]